MSDEHKRPLIGSQRFPGIDIQMVRRLVQEQKIRLFQQNFRKAQTGQFAARKCRTRLEYIFTTKIQLGQVAAHLKFREFWIFVPNRADDRAASAKLLLFEHRRLCASA